CQCKGQGRCQGECRWRAWSGVDGCAAVFRYHLALVRHAWRERHAGAWELRRVVGDRHSGVRRARADRYVAYSKESRMSAPRVYLHALGMINALGHDVDTIVTSLAAGHAPGMRAESTRT